MELFKKYPDITKYEIGDNGTVRSTSYKNSNKTKELCSFLDKDGYSCVFLHKNGKKIKKLVHRLVLLTWVSNPENKPCVNHINGVRNDNRLENLEWCTHSENCLHSYRVNGRKHTQKQIKMSTERFTGTSNPKAKLNESTVLSIRRLRAKGLSLKEISERHDISKAQVSAICIGKFWKNIYTNPELLNAK